MQNSKMFTRTIPRISVLGEEGSLFPFSEIVSKLSYCTAICKIQKFIRGQNHAPRTSVLGEGKFSRFPNNAEFKFCPGTIFRTPVSGEETFDFVLRKWTKLSYSNAELKNFPGDKTLDLRVRGEERLFFVCFVLKLSYSNAEFKHFPGDNTPDPRFRGEDNMYLFSENAP